MEIKQFKYSSDNFSYLVYGNAEAVGIDCGAVHDILDFTNDKGLRLKYVTNTHMHPDHTPGNGEILRRSKAEFIEINGLRQTNAIVIDDEPLEIMETPGHTANCFSFYTGGAIISGDTLFNGTVGNCFSGDLESFYTSIKKLLALPGNTIVYAGHDYVEYAMAFARTLEPDNPHIAEFLKAYNPYHVYSTLDDERKVNPYLRFNEPALIKRMEADGLPVESEYQRWHSIMQLG